MPVQIGAKAEHGFDQPLGLLSDCHRRIERFLAMLGVVAEQAGGGTLSDEQRRAVEAALEYFRVAAPRHTADEEESLFPMLRASGDPAARQVLEAVERLEADHAAAGAGHAEVEALYRRWTQSGRLGPDEVARLRAVLAGLEELYRRHIAVEDREVFPLAARALTGEQVKRLGEEMARRRGVGVRKDEG